MSAFNLHATSRSEIGKKVKKIRAKGLIPAVVYGRGREPESIAVEAKLFRKVYHEAGTSALVNLNIDEAKPIKVLFHEPQIHYLSGEPIHVDFYAVKMDEEIETAIPIHFVGVAPAADELEGNFITNKDELTIRCLPGDLIPSVEVDISVLKTFDDSIRVSDIHLPETVKVIDDLEEMVALVTPPRSEEELEAELAEDKAAEEAAVEALGEEPKSEAETTEGGEEPATEADEQPKPN